MADFVQNVDVNVGPAHYSGAFEVLRVTKVFYTLQGEGPFAGLPAVFVRLAGCDRGDKRDCPFCDTYFDFSAGSIWAFDALLDLMTELLPDPNIKPLVVITGGEPMLQNNLVGFIAYLWSNEWDSVQIESNGDRIPPGWLPVCSHVKLIISPKVVSGVYRPLKPHILSTAEALKFVIDHREESPYHDVPAWAQGRPNVWLSPLTVYKRAVEHNEVPSAWDATLVDHERTALNYQRVAALCKKYGYRASMQQHLFFNQE